MGAEEQNTPAKPSKAAASAQEIPTTPPYPDWSSSMQAYYTAGATPAPFFASTVPSPTPHPYLWGSQHPLIPPYGTPVPYSAIYPPGGVYAHPSMATTPSPAQTNADIEVKNTDGKDRGSTKKSKGTMGGKAGDAAKIASGSGNDGASQSGESGSEGTSDGSDENTNQQDKRGRTDQTVADVQSLVPGKPVVSVPATALNIGMDLWSASPAAAGPTKIRPNSSGAASAAASGMQDQWIQDERELKRQKRKQSNRESARRSRLRKQAECEELQARVDNLTNDNHNLREELQRLSEECEKLTSENNSIKEEMTKLCGPEAVAKLEQNNPSTVPQSRGSEGNS
ncbi:hypothetical protein SLE2022_361650 [Rubroshorea leprosula]